MKILSRAACFFCCFLGVYGVGNLYGMASAKRAVQAIRQSIAGKSPAVDTRPRVTKEKHQPMSDAVQQKTSLQNNARINKVSSPQKDYCPTPAQGIGTDLADINVVTFRDYPDFHVNDKFCAAFVPVLDNNGVPKLDDNGYEMGDCECTLRAAIQTANAAAHPVTVHIPSMQGNNGDYIPYILSFKGDQTVFPYGVLNAYPNGPIQFDDDSFEGDLDINNDMTLVGGGSGKTIISGEGLGYFERVLDIGPLKQGINVTIQGLTITKGDERGIRNQGNLTLQDVIVSGNGDTIADWVQGGGIDNEEGAHLTLENSRVESNKARYEGAGIANAKGSVTKLIKSTVTSNISSNGFAGAGIFNDKGSTLYLEDSTVSDNQGTGISLISHAISVGNAFIINDNASLSIKSLAFNSSTNTLYAGTGGGVFVKTQNNGAWTILNKNQGLGQTTYTFALAVDSSTDTVYAKMVNDIFSSVEGKAWSSVLAAPMPGVLSLAFDPVKGILYAGGSTGVTQSQNDGPWSQTAGNQGLTNTNVLSLVFDSSSHTLYAGTQGGIFKYQDGGVWTLASQFSNVNALAYDSKNNVLYAASGSISRSADGGQTWSDVSNQGLGYATINALAFDSTTQTLYAGTENDGVYSSANGGAWTPVAGNQGLTSTDKSNLTALRSTISGNSGDGIDVTNRDTAVLVNSTVVENKGSGLSLQGNLDPVSLTLRNATIANNQAGISSVYHVTVDMKDSLLVANKDKNGKIDNCSAMISQYNQGGLQISSGGYNFFGSDFNSQACPVSMVKGDKILSAPDEMNLLQMTLTNNNGAYPSMVYLLNLQSPAIDSGDPNGCTDDQGNPLTSDQRGVSRPQGGNCDLGAVEMAPADLGK